MGSTVLKLHNVTKTYILGQRKNAKKAQKAIANLQNKYQKLADKDRPADLKRLEDQLNKVQILFSNDKYEESYRAATGKSIKQRKSDRGAIVHALRGVSIDIKEGELVAVMGPSGSGKSTLLNMLGLLDKPTAGQIFLGDSNVTTIKKRELPEIRAKKIGFVFQSHNLVPSLTALENVMLPLKYSGLGKSRRKQMARQALEQVGLGDRIGHNPNELSGGQRQRVAIARSIVNSPSIIFGDELTGELDSKMTKEVMNLIAKLNKKGQTFIIVTHNPEVAKMCRRVIHMRDGRIEKQTSRK